MKLGQKHGKLLTSPSESDNMAQRSKDSRRIVAKAIIRKPCRGWLSYELAFILAVFIAWVFFLGACILRD